MVQPHRKSISKLWLRMMMTCSLPNLSTVAWSVYRVHSVPDHHSSSITSSAHTETRQNRDATVRRDLLFLYCEEGIHIHCDADMNANKNMQPFRCEQEFKPLTPAGCGVKLHLN